MAKTTTELIASVKVNLGQTASGTLGESSIEDAILDKINMIVGRIARKFPALQSLHRIAQFTITTGAYYYAFPTTDTDDNTIRIRNIFGVWATDSDDNAWVLERVSPTRRLLSFPNTNADISEGRPKSYAVWGRYFYLHPYPDDTYTANLWVTITPTTLVHDETQPLGDEFDSLIEAGATMFMFAAKQEPEDYAAWRSIYREMLDELMTDELSKPDWHILGINRNVISEPWNDPFVRSLGSFNRRRR